MPTYTAEELSNKTTISNTEANFEQISDAVVPANEVWYSVDTNTARVGDGVTTWGSLVPFLYGENLDVNVVQKITGSWEGITLPSENTVPSTKAVNDALTNLTTSINKNITDNVGNVNDTIDELSSSVDEQIEEINATLKQINTLNTNLQGVSDTLASLEDAVDPDNIHSPIYATNTNLDTLTNTVNTLEQTVKKINNVAGTITSLPLSVAQGGTGVTSDSLLKDKISKLGFALSSSINSSQSTASTAGRLAKPVTIKVYHYTTGAGNIVTSYITNMSGSVSFDGSQSVNIPMLYATYTNCNCRCDDDY